MVAKIFEIHPRNPQPRLIEQVVDLLHDGAVIVYPTDSGYALGCQIGNQAGADRIRRIKNLGNDHHFTLVCSEFAQLGQLVQLGNRQFRAIKAATPGPYTFVLPATREVPRRLAHPKKKTVGVRIPDFKVARELVAALGEPLVSSTLLLADDGAQLGRYDDAGRRGNVAGGADWEDDEWSGEVWDDAEWDGASEDDESGDGADEPWAEEPWVEDEPTQFPAWLLSQVDAIIDAGPIPTTPTTVIDWSGPDPELLRAGAGDPGRFV